MARAKGEASEAPSLLFREMSDRTEGGERQSGNKPRGEEREHVVSGATGKQTKRRGAHQRDRETNQEARSALARPGNKQEARGADTQCQARTGNKQEIGIGINAKGPKTRLKSVRRKGLQAGLFAMP